MCLKDADLIWKTFYLGSMSTISKLPFPLSPQISGLPAGPTCSEACWTPFSSNSWKSSTAFTPSAASVWDYGQDWRWPGCQRSGHPVAIPHRGHPHQHHRRPHRRHHRLRRKLDCEERSPLAYLYTGMERIPQLCRLYGDRSVLRMVSCKESSRLRPDRSNTIRVIIAYR